MHAPRKRKPTTRQAAARAEASSSVSSELKKKKSKRPWLENRPKSERHKPGQPHGNSLLTDALEEKILSYIRAGSTWVNACRICGVSIAAVEDWKTKGACLPGSRYAQFLEKAEQAVIHREAFHVSYIARDQDWKARRWLLMNWHPERYKDRWYQELAGPEGTPIPLAASPFVVNVTLASEPGQPQPQYEIRSLEKAKGNGDGRPD